MNDNGLQTIDGWLTEITADLEHVAVEPAEPEYGDDDIEIVECVPVDRVAPEHQLVRAGFLYATIVVSLLCAASTFLGA